MPYIRHRLGETHNFDSLPTLTCDFYQLAPLSIVSKRRSGNAAIEIETELFFKTPNLLLAVYNLHYIWDVDLVKVTGHCTISVVIDVK